MRFCEECGAKLEDDVRFCEECGAELEPIAQEPEAVPPLVNDVTDQVNLNREVSETPQRRIRGLFIPVVVLLVIAVMAGGYYIGKTSGVKQKQEQLTDNKNSENNETISQTDVTDVTPTLTPTNSVAAVTPNPASGADLAGKSIFEGYREVEHLGSVVTVQSPDGLYLSLDSTGKSDPMGYITDGVHYLEFDFFDSSSIRYPMSYSNTLELPDEGDALHVEFLDGEVYVCWSYHYNGQQVERYYDGWIAADYVTCIGQYQRYHAYSLQYFDTPKKILSYNPFDYVTDGKVVEVSYSGDDKEELMLGLTYSYESDRLWLEMYAYEQDAYLGGYAKGTIHYNTDNVYCLEPVYYDDGLCWEEIPYTIADGEKQYDLTRYNIYYEIRMNASEEGIFLRWSVHEDGVERVIYEDVFLANYMLRKTYVKHY